MHLVVVLIRVVFVRRASDKQQPSELQHKQPKPEPLAHVHLFKQKQDYVVVVDEQDDGQHIDEYGGAATEHNERERHRRVQVDNYLASTRCFQCECSTQDTQRRANAQHYDYQGQQGDTDRVELSQLPVLQQKRFATLTEHQQHKSVNRFQ